MLLTSVGCEVAWQAVSPDPELCSVGLISGRRPGRQKTSDVPLRINLQRQGILAALFVRGDLVYVVGG